MIVQRSFSSHYVLVRAVGLNITDIFFILIVYDTEMQRSGFKFSLFLCLALRAVREKYTSYKDRQVLEVCLHPWLCFLSHL